MKREQVFKLVAGLWLVLVLVSLSPAMAQEAVTKPIDPVSAARNEALAKAVAGSWSAAMGTEWIKLKLDPDLQYELNGNRGRYEVEPSALILHGTDGLESRYGVKLPVVNGVSGQQLELAGADLPQPLLFTREREVTDYTASMLSISPEDLRAKATRILVVSVIVLLAWVLTWILKEMSEFLIFSNRGPLRLIYASHKHRTRTIHSLIINVLKYVVYFTALGLILTEFGVNYTAYLASLSVIGLAIGFGSQGLVQDMVTGFFVIFESQYDVGDMVEISGQTGIVEELGLRMTRIRNYLGQRVVIPNRNIATVGKFHKGAQHVTVDVATREESDAEVITTIELLVGELAREFPGVVIGAPGVPEPLTLETGEHFVRVTFDIWPQQTWLIDQQLLPRIREQFKARGLDIPSDRIVPFYHRREQVFSPDAISAFRYITGSPND
ncbi:MAG: mechanosensitive ion channel [Proteobacteria bacterium]|nr:mechanosensitive ion channel [Pseudomonadota bacterium]MDA1302101.1 mechanosensitive ion channel [Pseudomonadota bacterium]